MKMVFRLQINTVEKGWMHLPFGRCFFIAHYSLRSRKVERAYFTQSDNFFVMCRVSLTRLHFLYSCKENEAKESTRGQSPSTPSHGTAAAGRMRHGRTRSAKLPKLNASRRFKHMGSFVFSSRHAKRRMARGKNPLTSHAVGEALRCLGLPSAYTQTKAGCENKRGA